MPDLTTLFWFFLVATLVAFLVRKRSRELETKSQIETFVRLKDVFAVWAAAGPFSSGDESGNALRTSFITARGQDFASENFHSILGHIESFTLNPASWEKLVWKSYELCRVKRKTI
jgi:hypothetical protein